MAHHATSSSSILPAPSTPTTPPPRLIHDNRFPDAYTLVKTNSLQLRDTKGAIRVTMCCRDKNLRSVETHLDGAPVVEGGKVGNVEELDRFINRCRKVHPLYHLMVLEGSYPSNYDEFSALREAVKDRPLRMMIGGKDGLNVHLVHDNFFRRTQICSNLVNGKLLRPENSHFLHLIVIVKEDFLATPPPSRHQVRVPYPDRKVKPLPSTTPPPRDSSSSKQGEGEGEGGAAPVILAVVEVKPQGRKEVEEKQQEEEEEEGVDAVLKEKMKKLVTYMADRGFSLEQVQKASQRQKQGNTNTSFVLEGGVGHRTFLKILRESEGGARGASPSSSATAPPLPPAQTPSTGPVSKVSSAPTVTDPRLKKRKAPLMPSDNQAQEGNSKSPSVPVAMAGAGVGNGQRRPRSPSPTGGDKRPRQDAWGASYRR